ncbi:hypothetical protein [Phormidium sp. CCY1219]|nr:hypothetical protein [Phormidium sp. CCY1219]MEB3827830.1 hypothetical protein [Phormidium sp. CCY1219]
MSKELSQGEEVFQSAKNRVRESGWSDSAEKIRLIFFPESSPAEKMLLK